MTTSRNVFEKRINIRELDNILAFGKRRRRSIMIFGGPGIGKSVKLKQSANKVFGYRDDNLVDVRLSDKEPTDVVGLPIPVTNPVTGVTTTVFATPSFWPKDPDWCGYVFLDELTNAGPDLQHVAYQIMLDGKIGDFVFPKGAVFVGAGNRDGDGGSTSVLLSPLANRMVIVEVDYDAEIWITDYALPANIHPSVIGWIKSAPDRICSMELAEKSDSISFSTPRSLEAASDALYDYDADLMDDRTTSIIIQGALGKNLDDELMHYHTRAKDLPSVFDILSGAVKEHELKAHQVDLLYIIGSQGITQLRKEVNDMTVVEDELLDRVSNFMTFMQTNYYAANKDFCTSVFLSLIQDTGMGSAVLRANSSREKLIPKLCRKRPEVLQVVYDYDSNFAALVAEAEKG